jgi:hypothetical protein
MHYNFVRIHQALKVARGALQMSDLVKVLEEWEAG